MIGYMLAPLAAMMQGTDVLAWPLIAAVLSLLSIAAVASAITAGLLRLSKTGIPPQSVVWLVCALLVTVAYFVAGGHLPMTDPANPVGTAAGWAVLVGALRLATTTLYDTVLHRVWPAPPNPDGPTPA